MPKPTEKEKVVIVKAKEVIPIAITATDIMAIAVGLTEEAKQ